MGEKATRKNSKERQPFHWRSSIAYKTKDRIVIRGYDNNQLTGNIDFASMAFLVWTGELPPDNYRLMVNALLVCLSEHAFSPSAASCRLVASGGVPLNTAVAGGILTLGSRHGSAEVPAAMFRAGIARCEKEGLAIEECAGRLVTEYRERKAILNGYHHPQHIKDPRVARLFELSVKYKIRGKHQELARAIEKCTEQVYGRTLYLNAPGALAAIGCDMGLTPEQIKGLMILARTVSLIGHSIEEMEREKGWRASTKSDITQPLDLSLQLPEFYDGPAERSLAEAERAGLFLPAGRDG